MKKTKHKYLILSIFTTILLMTSVTALAAGPVGKQLQVYFNNIKIVVDGKNIDLGKDSAGEKIEPFIYNGTTYLPVRAVSEALDLNVKWDSQTQTVQIGEMPGEVKYMTEVVPPYAGNAKKFAFNGKESLTMGGNEYKAGFKFTYSDHLLFNLDSKYSEITFDLGVTKYRYITSSNFDIYLDGELYKTISVSSDALPQKVTIPVRGVMQLKLVSDNSYNYIEMGVGDPIIK